MNNSVAAPEAGTPAEASPAHTSQAGPSAPGVRPTARRRQLTILAAVVILCGVGYGTYWLL